ncbi:extracellular solute-binding protein [Paenibacillus ginsengarvi]|uniref:Extracellular solute-binding protein n=1 Tax=Paenibacillus ginsengarvi TaxID=400777 RepID=A0A3B0BRK3_9BACL|nr:extracellular solute-binding protein [Paenibacillus ginsengarvi]RKN74968.1 extracellular solute-binding protein [Paenibacillus ginsengarvi]
MKSYKVKLFGLLAASALLLTACGGTGSKDNVQAPAQSGDQPAPANKAPEPVTLNFFYNGFSESLTNEVKRMIETKFPHVTINMILHGTGKTINDVLLAGTEVDLAAFTMGQLFNVLDLQLASDLTDLIKKHQFDLGRLSDGVLDTVRGYSEKGDIPVMPYELNNSVLLYNKTIFNKFGLPYPTDGMTWDGVYDIVKKTSREDNGVVYRGFAYTGANPVYKNQLGLPFVDPQTNKAALNTDSWKKWLQTMTGFYALDNNKLQTSTADNLFFKDMVMALRTGPNPLDLLPPAIKNGLDWDAVSMPTFSAAESSGSQMNAPFYIIPPQSKKKDAAFEVIAYLMSDEVQSWGAKQGRVPIVKSRAVSDRFGEDLPFLKGTNYSKAVFAEKIAKPIRVTKYDGIARTELTNTLAKVATNGTDPNTALREAEELANKAIQEAKR